MVMYRDPCDGSLQYDIAVGQADGTCQTYRTKSLLSDGGGVYLHGRGTRVWRAVRMENGEESGEVVALKDSWVDEYREREAAINSRILDAASTQGERDGLKDLMVNVASHGDVFIAGALDRTRACRQGQPAMFT